MLINDVFAIEKENAIKTIKIMTKKRIYLILDISIKFNDIMIRLVSSKDIILSQETRIESVSLIKNYEISITNSRDIVRERLSLKKQYVTQRARDAYIASICQFEIFFDLFYVAQSTKFFSDDINALNRRLK